MSRLRYCARMRLSVFVLLFSMLPGLARADQFDPALDDRFAQLRAGEGDIAEIEATIIQTWLTPPEPGIAVLMERAIIALDRNALAVAEVLIEHINGLAPNYAEGWMLNGRLAQARDDVIGAAGAFDRVTTLEPRHFRAWEALGDLALQTGDRDLAHQHFRRALDWNPQWQELRVRADRLRRELGSQEI